MSSNKSLRLKSRVHKTHIFKGRVLNNLQLFLKTNSEFQQSKGYTTDELVLLSSENLKLDFVQYIKKRYFANVLEPIESF